MPEPLAPDALDRLAALCTVPTPTAVLPDPEHGTVVLAKLEYGQPSGSTKDRIAAAILLAAAAEGRLHRGSTVVEASSGSTSISLARACALLGVPFRAVMPEGVSGERLLIIQRYGGAWELTPAAGGVPGAIARTHELAAEDPSVLLADQFNNPENVAAHERGTGAELVAQVAALPALGGRLDGFVAAVGTGGTLMGVGAAVRRAAPQAVIARVRVAEGPADAEQGGLPCGIPGVVDCLSGLLDADALDLAPDVAVRRADALAATRELGQLGFPVGPSSGLNLVGARRAAAALGPGSVVATVLCDRMERYFSTDLFDDVRG